MCHSPPSLLNCTWISVMYVHSANAFPRSRVIRTLVEAILYDNGITEVHFFPLQTWHGSDKDRATRTQTQNTVATRAVTLLWVTLPQSPLSVTHLQQAWLNSGSPLIGQLGNSWLNYPGSKFDTSHWWAWMCVCLCVNYFALGVCGFPFHVHPHIRVKTGITLSLG